MAKKEAATNKQKKQLAFDLFISTDKNQKQIAAMVGTSTVSMSKWVNEGLWEELKVAETITAKKIVVQLYKKLFEQIQADKLNADEISKIASSIEKISDKRITVPQMINTFKGFDTFLFNKNPELARQITAYQDEYIQDQIKS